MEIEILIEGSILSGHRGHTGIPGHWGGSMPKGRTAPPVVGDGDKVSGHGDPLIQPEVPMDVLRGLTDRELEVYNMLNAGLTYINKATLPRTRWYRMVRDKQGKLMGYIIGEGRVVLSVLNALYGNKDIPDVVLELDEPEIAGLDVKASIQNQLAALTDEQAKRLSASSAKELAASWTDDWSIEGLTRLLFVQMPKEGVDNGGDGTTDQGAR